MAKKKVSSNAGLHHFGGILALISLFITGFVYIINLVLSLFDGSFDAGVLNLVASISMLVSIVIVSWGSLSAAKLPGKRSVWYILYWAFVILAFIGQINL